MLKKLWATFVDLTYAWNRCWASCLDHLLSILQSVQEDTNHFPYGTLQPITLPVSGLAMKAARFLALSLSLSLFPPCSFKPITTYIYKLYLYRHRSVQYNAVYGCSLITKLVSLFWQLLCSWHNETCLGFIHSYMVAFFYILSSTASFEMYLGVGQDMDTEIYCSKNESNTKKTHQISGKEKISDSGDYQTKNKTKKMLTSNGFLFVLYHSDISIMCNASQ